MKIDRREYHKRKYEKNKEKRKMQMREYYLSHKEDYNRRRKKWRINNPHYRVVVSPKLIEMRREAIRVKKEKSLLKAERRHFVKILRRILRVKTAEERKNDVYLRIRQLEEQRISQREIRRIKRAQRKYEREKLRRRNNIQYKLTSTLRRRINDAIRRGTKAGSAVRDLGCTISELKFYLEGKFTDGMTWGNHGLYGWHIDHIIPLAYFDLTDREQFLRAVHYTNLQPLWAKENMKKGDKILA